ncbi:unnamed protein product [Coffea canephora]|uniref:pectinesterase n=1 Tax=Coffea canephora TaxID=49390 RepID=A0A068UIP6_COFCA|nr:unnamed protein product [Coffea canephora]
MNVDQSGKGDHHRIQDAIDAEPFNNSHHVYILVNAGTYKEKIAVPANKAFITLSAIKPGTTIITCIQRLWGHIWFSNFFFFSFFPLLINDVRFKMKLIASSSRNNGTKAVALRASADRVSFFSFFKKCHLHSVSQGNGAITSQPRQSSSQETGFIFVGCKVSEAKSALPGRPWGDYSRVLFQTKDGVLRGVQVLWTRCKAPWSYGLTTQEVAPYLGWGVVGGPSWILSANYARIKRISTMTSNNFHGG